MEIVLWPVCRLAKTKNIVGCLAGGTQAFSTETMEKFCSAKKIDSFLIQWTLTGKEIVFPLAKDFPLAQFSICNVNFAIVHQVERMKINLLENYVKHKTGVSICLPQFRLCSIFPTNFPGDKIYDLLQKIISYQTDLHRISCGALLNFQFAGIQWR